MKQLSYGKEIKLFKTSRHHWVVAMAKLMQYDLQEIIYLGKDFYYYFVQKASCNYAEHLLQQFFLRTAEIRHQKPS